MCLVFVHIGGHFPAGINNQANQIFVCRTEALCVLLWENVSENGYKK